MKKYKIAGRVLCIVSILVFYFSFFETSEPEKKSVVKKLDVRVFFGYKDARPARFVADRYERAIFIQRLIGPCSDGRQDCQFVQFFDEREEAHDTQVFYKQVHNRNGDPVRIELRVFASSAGADDHENRKNPFQKWRSDYVKDQFAKALKTADIVFYNGHSRAGGGPDFSTPELTKAKHVHYTSYQKNKPGLIFIQETLKQNPNSPLQVLGLYSCQSDQLFKKKVEAAKPSLKVIGSRQLLYFSDALNDSLDQLSQILKTI